MESLIKNNQELSRKKLKICNNYLLGNEKKGLLIPVLI